MEARTLERTRVRAWCTIPLSCPSAWAQTGTTLAQGAPYLSSQLIPWGFQQLNNFVYYLILSICLGEREIPVISFKTGTKVINVSFQWQCLWLGYGWRKEQAFKSSPFKTSPVPSLSFCSVPPSPPNSHWETYDLFTVRTLVKTSVPLHIILSMKILRRWFPLNFFLIFIYFATKQ